MFSVFSSEVWATYGIGQEKALNAQRGASLIQRDECTTCSTTSPSTSPTLISTSPPRPPPHLDTLSPGAKAGLCAGLAVFFLSFFLLLFLLGRRHRKRLEREAEDAEREMDKVGEVARMGSLRRDGLARGGGRGVRSEESRVMGRVDEERRSSEADVGLETYGRRDSEADHHDTWYRQATLARTPSSLPSEDVEPRKSLHVLESRVEIVLGVDADTSSSESESEPETPCKSKPKARLSAKNKAQIRRVRASVLSGKSVGDEGWDADADADSEGYGGSGSEKEVEGEEYARGRQAMSLPRRDY